MEFNPESRKFSVTTSEPFGKLLVELMHNKSFDEQILKVQQYVGGLLVDAYINNVFSDLDTINSGNYKHILDINMARDIASKAENFARSNTIDITFDDEHIDGLKKISLREVNDLPGLLAEREMVTGSTDMGFVAYSGRLIDDNEVVMIDEEIEQAKAAQEVLKIIS